MHVTNLTMYNIFQDLSTCVLSGVCVSRRFYLYLPVSICVYLCFTCIYLCSPVSYLYLSVSTCVHQCPSMSTCVHLCPSMSICVHPCPSVFICVHLCPPVSTCVHPCPSVFIHVHLCSSVSTCVHLCLHVLPVSCHTVGPLVLYKGITPALIRSIPANGALWLGYNVSKPHFDSLLS